MNDRQPRWPRGTPVAPSGRGPGGGRFRGTDPGLALRHPGWLGAVAGRLGRAAHPAYLGLTGPQLRDLADNPPGLPNVSRMAGGQQASTSLLTYGDGRQVITKVFGGNNAEHEAQAEYLASLVGQAIGAPVPHVIMVDPRTVWMGVIDGDTGLGIARAANPSLSRDGLYDATDDLENQWADLDPAWRLGLLDLIVANNDRHPGNWMGRTEPDGTVRLAGIDHGMSFFSFRGSPPSAPRDSTPPSYLAESGIFRVLLTVPDRPEMGYDTTRLSSAEAREIDDRLRALEPEFARLGRQEWHAWMMWRWGGYRDAILGAGQ